MVLKGDSVGRHFDSAEEAKAFELQLMDKILPDLKSSLELTTSYRAATKTYEL